MPFAATPITASTGSNWLDPTYDAAGSMATGPSPTAPDDQNGDEHRYTYDAWNRLAEIESRTYSSGTPSAWATVAEYEYDGLGRRIIKHVYDAGTFDYSDHSYYNGWQVVEVRRDTDSTKGGDPDADPMEQFVYHTYYIDAVAVRYWDDPDDGGGLDGTQVEQYYLHDAQFNVIALTDDTGAVIERYRYAPYGEQTVMDASYSVKSGGTDYEQYKGFTGQTLDPESGLWYFRSRYYSDGLGRFISRDYLHYPDGMNASGAYFAALGIIDPTGREAADPEIRVFALDRWRGFIGDDDPLRHGLVEGGLFWDPYEGENPFAHADITLTRLAFEWDIWSCTFFDRMGGSSSGSWDYLVDGFESKGTDRSANPWLHLGLGPGYIPILQEVRDRFRTDWFSEFAERSINCTRGRVEFTYEVGGLHLEEGYDREEVLRGTFPHRGLTRNPDAVNDSNGGPHPRRYAVDSDNPGRQDYRGVEGYFQPNRMFPFANSPRVGYWSETEGYPIFYWTGHQSVSNRLVIEWDFCDGDGSATTGEVKWTTYDRTFYRYDWRITGSGTSEINLLEAPGLEQ